jgi:NAD(P)-dependent dehydrogenase (short-subunit alcohol dehydrogenase family)
VSGQIRFDGDVVIVTGGAGGIGRCQAIELGRRGARVVVNDLGGSPRGGGADATMARAVADEIVAAGGEAVASTVSVCTDDGPQQIVELALDTWGRVDGLIPLRRRPACPVRSVRPRTPPRKWASSG